MILGLKLAHLRKHWPRNGTMGASVKFKLFGEFHLAIRLDG